MTFAVVEAGEEVIVGLNDDVILGDGCSFLCFMYFSKHSIIFCCSSGELM